MCENPRNWEDLGFQYDDVIIKKHHNTHQNIISPENPSESIPGPAFLRPFCHDNFIALRESSLRSAMVRKVGIHGSNGEI